MYPVYFLSVKVIAPNGYFIKSEFTVKFSPSFKISALLLSALLIGCGGGGGGGSSSNAGTGSTGSDNTGSDNTGSDNSGSTPTTPTTPDSFAGNGVYYDQNSNRLAIVDAERSTYNILYSDLDNPLNLYMTMTAQTVGSTRMNTVGVVHATNGQRSTDADQKIAATFFDDKVVLTAPAIDLFAQSMLKTSGTLALNELTGTYTAPDGSTAQINADGSYVLNFDCTVSGNLVRKVDYFSADDANAVGCAQTAYNGDYDGFVFTYVGSGETVLGFVYGKQDANLWVFFVKE